MMDVRIIPFPYNNGNRRRKRQIIAAVAAGVFVVLWSLCVYSEVSFREISDHVLRLHVLANSDSEEDQALKLKVRDRVLTKADTLLVDCVSRQEAQSCIADNMELLCKEAVDCVEEEGYTYPVTVRMEEIYFPTRSYEGGALPAGVYTALRVEIGEAAGKNWWCVLFPQLCLVNATVPKNSAEPMTTTTPQPTPTPEPVSVQTGSVTLRFKLIDIFQKTKQEIKSIWSWIVG